MGLLGSIVGGALQGVGTGIQQDAVAQRQAALQALAEQNARDMQQASFTHADTSQEAGFAHEDTARAQDNTNRMGLLALGGQIDMTKDDHSTQNDLKKIGAQFINQKQLAVLNSKLQMAQDAASITLRDKLTNGDIDTVVRGKDGTYWGVTKTGLVPTGVKADTTAAEVKSDGGGYIDKDARENMFDDDTKAWRAAGGSASGKPQPKKSDYVGMTHADVAARLAGGSTPAPDTGATAAPAAPVADPKRVTKAITDLANIYPTATPDKYPRLFVNGRKMSLAEARAALIQHIGG